MITIKNLTTFLFCGLTGLLIGTVVFFIPYSIGRRDQRDEYKVTMDTNNIDYITIDLDDNTNIIIKNCKFYDDPNYDVEDMIDAETEKMLSKHYYAMIITKEHPMWREPKDKYQVLLKLTLIGIMNDNH